jgi:hypothetical protein
MNFSADIADMALLSDSDFWLYRLEARDWLVVLVLFGLILWLLSRTQFWPTVVDYLKNRSQEFLPTEANQRTPGLSGFREWFLVLLGVWLPWVMNVLIHSWWFDIWDFIPLWMGQPNILECIYLISYLPATALIIYAGWRSQSYRKIRNVCLMLVFTLMGISLAIEWPSFPWPVLFGSLLWLFLNLGVFLIVGGTLKIQMARANEPKAPTKPISLKFLLVTMTLTCLFIASFQWFWTYLNEDLSNQAMARTLIAYWVYSFILVISAILVFQPLRTRSLRVIGICFGLILALTAVSAPLNYANAEEARQVSEEAGFPVGETSLVLTLINELKQNFRTVFFMIFVRLGFAWVGLYVIFPSQKSDRAQNVESVELPASA